MDVIKLAIERFARICQIKMVAVRIWSMWVLWEMYVISLSLLYSDYEQVDAHIISHSQ